MAPMLILDRIFCNTPTTLDCALRKYLQRAKGEFISRSKVDLSAVTSPFVGLAMLCRASRTYNVHNLYLMFG